MKVLTLDQNTPEWLAWREANALKMGFASEAAAVMGAGKFRPRNRRELWLAKKGLLPRPGGSAIAHGHNMEPIARKWLESYLGEAFKPVVGESQCGRFGVSLDGLTFDGEIAIEIKCPISGAKGDLWQHVMLNEVPEYYHWQLVQQAAISGAKEMIFCVFIAQMFVASPFYTPLGPYWVPYR